MQIMTLGTKLANLRSIKNLSQLEIAQRLEVSQNAYNKWESDKSKPSMENLLKIADFYESDIYDLLADVSNVNFSNLKLRMTKVDEKSNSPISKYPHALEEEQIGNQAQINQLIDAQSQLIDAQNKLIENLMDKKE